jgi:acetyltransferase-like isoleucine patch superfamily enzyme
MVYRTLALSDHWFWRTLRSLRRKVLNFSLPLPRLVLIPFVSLFLVARSVYYFIARVFFCEPFFKFYCTRYGKNLHTGVYFHWVQGKGELLIGDNVVVDGKCSFTFAVRYSPRPTLIIGDNTGIGHHSRFTVGNSITIGSHCRIASGVWLLDSPGHPLDPALRMAGHPAPKEDVRPVVIEDKVWIGSGALIMPGVTIGTGSVVSAGAVVMNSVPANVLVAGNPARQIRVLVTPPEVPKK